MSKIIDNNKRFELRANRKQDRECNICWKPIQVGEQYVHVVNWLHVNDENFDTIIVSHSMHQDCTPAAKRYTPISAEERHVQLLWQGV